MGRRECFHNKPSTWDGAARQITFLESGHLACGSHGGRKRFCELCNVLLTKVDAWKQHRYAFSAYDSLVQRILHSKQKDPLCIKTDKRYFWRLWKEWWTHWWLEQSCSKHNPATIYTVPVRDVSWAMPNGWNFAFCGTLPVMIGNKISWFF